MFPSCHNTRRTIVAAILALFALTVVRADELTRYGPGPSGGGGCGGTIAYNSTADLGSSFSGGLTTAYNGPSLTCRLLFAVLIGDISSSSPSETATAAYAGTSLTQCESVTGQTSQGRNIFAFYLFGGATGSNNFVFTTSSGQFIAAGVVAYSGVSATSQPDAHNNAQSAGGSADLTSNLTTISDNSWELTSITGSGSSVSITSGATQRSTDGTFGSWILADSGTITPAGSHSVVTHETNTANIMVHLNCAFHP